MIRYRKESEKRINKIEQRVLRQIEKGMAEIKAERGQLQQRDSRMQWSIRKDWVEQRALKEYAKTNRKLLDRNKDQITKTAKEGKSAQNRLESLEDAEKGLKREKQCLESKIVKAGKELDDVSNQKLMLSFAVRKTKERFNQT